MRLKYQFIILILGIILIPLIVMGISFSIFNKFQYTSDPRVVSQKFFSKIDNIKSLDELESITEDLEEFYIPIILPKLETANIESTIIIDSKKYSLDDGSEFTILLGVLIDTIVFS